MKPYRTDLILNYSALLFDLDGTLVDSMPAHNKAWQTALRLYGVDITEEELYKLAGTPNFKTAEIFIERFQLNIPPEVVVTEKESIFEMSVPLLKMVPVVAEIAQMFHKKIPLGIVSGSSNSRIQQSLTATGLETLFKCIVSCDDTERGKPYPDPYELGAKLLGVSSDQCLVFEDGEAGIQAALSAKMDVVYVKSGSIYFWED
jgi:beta-phosphoglucomutase-like phosphatase (HAD superfamily)